MFTKSDFDINLNDDTVTCPNGVSTPIRRSDAGDGIAYFGQACRDCPLRAQCTKAAGGRTIAVGRHERRLARMRGIGRIDADFNLLAAAHNLARLARRGLRQATAGWAVAAA